MKLIGRDDATLLIEALLDAARGGEGGALVLRGEAGVGLSALLDYAADSAADMRTLRVSGVEEEVDVPYGGLHRLLAAELGRHHDIPEPGRLSLQQTFGSERVPSHGMPFGAPNVLLVGLAALKVLVKASDEQPILCMADDVEQLDEETAATLGFVSRRLGGSPIAMLFARHDPSETDDFHTDLDDLLVRRLEDAHARELIDAVLGPGLQVEVRERILVETAGNPLAIQGLPSGSSTEPASAFAAPLPLAGRLEEHYARRLERLPRPTRDLLLLAAALTDGSAAFFWSAAECLGLDGDASGVAENMGLLCVGRRVRLANGVARSAVYGLAEPDDRRRIHLAIAEAADFAGDASRAAWHRAAAAHGPDEAIAAALVAAADQTGRADPALAAVFLERACSLTPEPALQGERLLHAAEKTLAAGSPTHSAALVAEASALPLSRLDRARSAKLRAQIALSLGEGGDSATLVRAAQAIAALDERLGREAFLEALEVAIQLTAFGHEGGLVEAAQAALEYSTDATDSASELLLHGLALLFTSGHEAAVPTLSKAIHSIKDGSDLRWLPLAGLVALELWDDEALERMVSFEAELGERARLTPNGLALVYLAGVDHTIAGRFAKAVERYEDIRFVDDVALDPSVAEGAAKGLVIVSAWRGIPENAGARIGHFAHEVVTHDLGLHYALARYAEAVLENSLGHYEAALIAAREAVEDRGLYIATFALPELIEAAVRSGEPVIAVSGLRDLEARAVPSGTNWALGMLARSRALLAEGADAEQLYREAIGRLVECVAMPQLARAHLLYGEWLRRERRRRDAREQLRRAEGMFVAMSAEAFTVRTQRELLLTGEHMRSRRDVHAAGLTVQETRIADLASTGASNPEIGAQLFISPRTVEYHLRKVYRKLEISSRVELGRRLITINE